MGVQGLLPNHPRVYCVTVLKSFQFKSPYMSVTCDLLIYNYQNTITGVSNNDQQTPKDNSIFIMFWSFMSRKKNVRKLFIKNSYKS